MEYKNKIELRGIVGHSEIATVGDTKVARFSLVTEYLYKGRDGSAQIDCTWFNCVAWHKDSNPSLESIVKGAPIELTGRVRSNRYTASDGTERYAIEILVNKFELADMP